MKWVLIVFPLAITYYTFTYGHWAWKKGNRPGAVGVFFLAAFNLALAVYGLYFKQSF